MVDDPDDGDRPISDIARKSGIPRKTVIIWGCVGAVLLAAYIMARNTGDHTPPTPSAPQHAVTSNVVEPPLAAPAINKTPPPPPPPPAPPPPSVDRMLAQTPPPPRQNGPDPRFSFFKIPPPPERPAVAAEKDQDGHTKVAFTGTSIPGSRAGKALNLTYTLMPGLYMCTLTTAIDTTVSGPFQCKLDRNAVSSGYADTSGRTRPGSSITLMEAGTTITGKYGSQGMQQGQSRIAAVSVWAVTPNGIPVPLDSPIGDELGRAGFSGNIDNHLWERFGAGVLLLLTDNAFNMAQSALQSGSNGNTNFNISSGGAQSVASQVLNQTINIPPTLTKNQGERIGIFILNPVDFSDAYKVRPTQ
jgi:type IV secretion system protein VirB10